MGKGDPLGHLPLLSPCLVHEQHLPEESTPPCRGAQPCRRGGLISEHCGSNGNADKKVGIGKKKKATEIEQWMTLREEEKVLNFKGGIKTGHAESEVN